MKSTLLKLSIFAVLSAAPLVFIGCASAPKENQTTMINFKPGVPGGTFVEKYQTSVRVAAVNEGSREVTFLAQDGSTNTFRAGPEVANFDRYRVGDTMKVVVVRELAMYLEKDAPQAVSDVAGIIRATPGIEPGVLTADTVQLNATVTSVDPKKQDATLRLSDGRVATVKVRKDIDLTRVDMGTEGLIRISAALAVMRDKP